MAIKIQHTFQAGEKIPACLVDLPSGVNVASVTAAENITKEIIWKLVYVEGDSDQLTANFAAFAPDGITRAGTMMREIQFTPGDSSERWDALAYEAAKQTDYFADGEDV